jgi:8-oxo-dGTP pyrophosphatase MutT (NUDIX family)
VFPRWHGDDLYRTRGATATPDEVVRMATMYRSHVSDLPKGAGALIRDRHGRVLVVEPTYQEGWMVPGGGCEGSETPREGCERELLEELGLRLTVGDLLCVHDRGNRWRFLFDGGVLDDDQIASIVLPPDELRSFRFADLDEAYELLHPTLAARLRATIDAPGPFPITI